MINMITEKDVIKKIAGICSNRVSIFKPLTEEAGIDEQAVDEVICTLENDFSLEHERYDLQRIKSISDIVNYINERSGIHGLAIRDVFRETCLDKTKVREIIFDGTHYPYAQIFELVEGLAANMQHTGIRKGTKVALIMQNRFEYILTYFALFELGALPVPISTRWKGKEIENVLYDSEAQYIICDEKVDGNTTGVFVSDYLKQRPEQIKYVFYFGTGIYGDKGISFSKLMEGHEKIMEPLEEVYPDDMSIISYTSGTTGKPKGVVLRQNDCVRISLYSTRLFDDNVKPFSIAPLYSAQGFLSMFMNLTVSKGFKMISSHSPNDILREISKGDVTVIHTQPTMWTLLLNCRAINFTDFSNLSKVVVSGSLCSRELAKQIEQRMGCRVINIYGLIEATSAVTMTREDDPEEIRFGTVGRPIPGVQIKIVDEKRNEVRHGDIGELAVRGFCMKEYYKNPDKTKAVLDEEGWLYTGDLARYYDDENISIVGRCKDMIIRGGFNVYPSDIEECIFELPQVQDVAVIGRNHELFGEEIIAYIVVKPGEKLEERDVRSWVFRNIANYKNPDKIVFISEMPIILSGKIDKKMLSEWAIDGVPQDKQILFG